MAVPILAGAATLNMSVLVDSLVTDVIDGLREDLHPAFGVRAYRLYRVLRSWSGAEVGDGVHSDDASELRPQPLVSMWDGTKFVQALCGVRELGEVRCTEISLTYTEAQLTGQPLTKRQELFYGIGEAHGQGSNTRLFQLSGTPWIDRVKDMGWVMSLRRIPEGSPQWLPT